MLLHKCTRFAIIIGRVTSHHTTFERHSDFSRVVTFSCSFFRLTLLCVAVNF